MRRDQRTLVLCIVLFNRFAPASTKRPGCLFESQTNVADDQSQIVHFLTGFAFQMVVRLDWSVQKRKMSSTLIGVHFSQ